MTGMLDVRAISTALMTCGTQARPPATHTGELGSKKSFCMSTTTRACLSLMVVYECGRIVYGMLASGLESLWVGTMCLSETAQHALVAIWSLIY